MSNRAERAAVNTLAGALVGTDRPFVLASGVSGLVQGRSAVESDASPAIGPDSMRGGSENLGLEYLDRGVRTISAGFAPTVHQGDAARLVRIAIERAPAGTILHAVAEESIPTPVISEGIGSLLGIPVTSVAPEDAVAHFGFIGRFFGVNMAASSVRTRASFDWEPSGSTLLDDIANGAYAES